MTDVYDNLPLADLHVVELSQNPAGDLAGKLLADLGASVTKLELAENLGLRNVGPFVGDVPDPEQSLSFAYYNGGKQSVLLAEPFTVEKLSDGLLEGIDVLISTLHPADYDDLGRVYEDLLKAYPSLIIASITPFGLEGPLSHYRASDLVSMAMGGTLHLCGYDDLEISPIRPGGDQGFHTATSFAHMGVMLALISRQSDGQGQLVDVSMQDALAVTIEMAFPYWEYQQTELRRQTCRHAQPTLTQPALFKCGDGKYIYLVLIINEPKAWANLVDWLGTHDFSLDLTDEAYSDGEYRQQQSSYIQGIVESFMQLNDSDTIYREGQARGLPVGVVNAPEDLFTDGHLVARQFFQNVETENFGPLVLPGPPYRFDSLDWRIGGPPPRLGQNLQGAGAEGR